MENLSVSSHILADGGNFITVYSDVELTQEEIEKHAKEHNATFHQRHGPLANIPITDGNYRPRMKFEYLFIPN